jgi:hypothetical protein
MINAMATGSAASARSAAASTIARTGATSFNARRSWR